MRPIIMPQLLHPDSNSNLKRVVKEESSSLSSPTEAVRAKLTPFPGRRSEWRTIRTGSALELQSPVEEQQERRERGRMVQRLSTPLYLLPLQQQEKNQTAREGIEQAETVAEVSPKKEGTALMRTSAPLAPDKDENIAVVNNHDDEPTEESTERCTEVDVVEVRPIVDIQSPVVLSNQNENDVKETGEREKQKVGEENVPDDADDDDETPVLRNHNDINNQLEEWTTPRRASVPQRLIERRTRSQNNNNKKRIPPNDSERFHQSCGSIRHQEGDATNLSPQQVVRRPRYQTFAQPMTMTQTETIEEPLYVLAGPRTRHLTRQSAAFQPGTPRGTEATKMASSGSGDLLKYTDISIRPSETYELGLDGSHHVLELVTVKTYTTLVTVPVMDGGHGPGTKNGDEAPIATTTTVVVVESPDTLETNELETEADHLDGFDDPENRDRDDHDHAHNNDEVNEFDYEEEESFWDDQEDLAAAKVAATLWQ